MDTKQIEYILKIAEENNITHAAQKLHLTQPALNQQLLKLERELGLQLFYRIKNNWRPTPAGELYLENARKMLQIKQDTYRMLADMADAQRGTLSVAFTPGRGSAMFSAVYPLFHQKYPEMTVEPRELSVRRQQTLIAEGELDIGFQTLCDEQRTGDAYLPIATEEIFLVLPEKHPLSQTAAAARSAGQDRPELPVSAVRYEPFVLMYKESTIRQMIDSIFDEAGFQPNVLFETASNATILSMIRNNICCGLVPACYLKDLPEGAACFSLPSHPTWDLVASYRKGMYLSKAARYFFQLASDFWTKP
ncbi:MAG: LysR substrate-binding domain-containing protein [Eubacteriales bacterium]|nr:LysR substrate-binding domain-containing protein [Eubacteriales bacterium]